MTREQGTLIKEARCKDMFQNPAALNISKKGGLRKLEGQAEQAHLGLMSTANRAGWGQMHARVGERSTCEATHSQQTQGSRGREGLYLELKKKETSILERVNWNSTNIFDNVAFKKTASTT